jgi:hypothetical protein
MPCRICGDEKAEYRERSRMTLCRSCHKTTHAKVGREAFDLEYWGSDWESVPHSIRSEFYSDYRASTFKSVAEYRHETSCPID